MDSSNQIETKAMADEEEAGEFGWQRVIKKKTKYSPYLPASQYSCHRGNVYRLDDFIAHGSHADVFSYTRLERENEDLLHSANNVNSNGFQHPRLGQGKDLYHDIDSDDGESTCSHDSLGSTTFESLNEPPDNRGTAAGPRGGNGGGGGGGGRPGPCGPPASPALLAVKVEPRDVRRPTLLYEARVMRRLAAAAAAAQASVDGGLDVGGRTAHRGGNVHKMNGSPALFRRVAVTVDRYIYAVVKRQKQSYARTTYLGSVFWSHTYVRLGVFHLII